MPDERFWETLAAPSIGAAEADSASGSPGGPPTLADRYTILGLLGAGGRRRSFTAWPAAPRTARPRPRPSRAARVVEAYLAPEA